MGYYLQRLTRAALWHGVQQRSRGWLFAGVALTVVRAVHHALAEPEGRAIVDVQPGDALEIRVVDPPTR